MEEDKDTNLKRGREIQDVYSRILYIREKLSS
jgi:hypothetical protein